MFGVRRCPSRIVLFGLADGLVLRSPLISTPVHPLGCQFGCQNLLMLRTTWAKVLTAMRQAMRQEFWSIVYRPEGLGAHEKLPTCARIELTTPKTGFAAWQ